MRAASRRDLSIGAPRGRSARLAAARRAARLGVLAAVVASAPSAEAARSPCAGALYAVQGPALLSERLGADAIRLGPDTAAIRSGCEPAPVLVHEVPTDEHVMRGQFTHCAIDGDQVALWLKVRDDCSKLYGRIGIRPQRHVRLFEAVRASEEELAWAPACACEEPPDVPACEQPAAAPCS